ncbi:hypothetical protein WJX72_002953 [[Myrmecia] bisecta]|uniref:Mitochondrial ribosomal protein S21 n=1 Tax=[Myrmecia] bisecta TaxID=41462 RepID=A0AAW1PSM7_9CHLO
MAALLQPSFTGLFNKLSLRPAPKHSLSSNGTASRVAMKGKNTYIVEVTVGEDEPADNAMKRFRRAVSSSGVIFEARRRRYFENTQDEKKRRFKDSRSKRKKLFRVATYDETNQSLEPAPFAEMFGDPDDIFAEVKALAE